MSAKSWPLTGWFTNVAKTDRQTGITDRQALQTDRHYRQTGITDRQKDIIDRQEDKQKKLSRNTDRQYRQADVQTERGTCRHRDRKTDGQTETERLVKD